MPLSKQPLPRPHQNQNQNRSRPPSDYNRIFTPDTPEIRLADWTGERYLVKAGEYTHLHLLRCDSVQVDLEPGVVFTRNDPSQGYGDTRMEDSVNCKVTGGEWTQIMTGPTFGSSTNCTYENFHVHHIGQEGLTTRRLWSHVGNRWVYPHSSKGCTYRFGYVHDTGRVNPQWGEGSYTGSGGQHPDETSDTTYEDIIFERVTSESLDVKPYTTNTTIRNVLVRDTKPRNSGAVVSWISRKGQADTPLGVTIDGIVVQNVDTGSQWTDGNGIKVEGQAVIRRAIVTDCQHRGIMVEVHPGTPVTLDRVSVASDSQYGDITVSDVSSMTLVDVSGRVIQNHYGSGSTSSIEYQPWHADLLNYLNDMCAYWGTDPIVLP